MRAAPPPDPGGALSRRQLLRGLAWRRHRAGVHDVPVREALDRLEAALVW